MLAFQNPDLIDPGLAWLASSKASFLGCISAGKGCFPGGFPNTHTHTQSENYNFVFLCFSYMLRMLLTARKCKHRLGYTNKLSVPTSTFESFRRQIALK